MTNLRRWLTHYFVEWILLGVIYSLAAAILLQTVLESVLKIELSVWSNIQVLLGILAFPAILEFGITGGVSVPVRFWFKKSLINIYLSHELRRFSTWITIAVTVAAIAFLPPAQKPFAVLLAMIPPLRALYSIGHWRRMALLISPKEGNRILIRGLWLSQTIQWALIWGLVFLAKAPSLDFSMALASWGAVIAACSVAFEGDSGRPWLVHLLALSVGMLGGFLCLATPWVLLAIFYMGSKMLEISENRLLSVENYDEDFIIP